MSFLSKVDTRSGKSLETVRRCENTNICVVRRAAENMTRFDDKTFLSSWAMVMLTYVEGGELKNAVAASCSSLVNLLSVGDRKHLLESDACHLQPCATLRIQMRASVGFQPQQYMWQKPKWFYTRDGIVSAIVLTYCYNGPCYCRWDCFGCSRLVPSLSGWVQLDSSLLPGA